MHTEREFQESFDSLLKAFQTRRVEYEQEQSMTNGFDIDALCIEGGCVLYPAKTEGTETGASQGRIEIPGAVRPPKAKKKHICPQCGQGFDRKSNLTEHIRSTHATLEESQGRIEIPGAVRPPKAKQNHICPQCKRGFARTSNLTQHIKRTHATLEELKQKGLSYSCNKCRKHFKRENELKVHVKQDRCTSRLNFS